MKKFIAIAFLFTLYACYETERSCKAYKTGTYYTETRINGTVYTSEFTRTKSLQVETYKDHIDSSEVRWINDCEVVFRTIHPKNRAERKDIHLKILTTTDTSYTYEYSYVGDVKKEKGVAYTTKP